MPRAETNRIGIYYEEFGGGEPLLLIRGLGSSCETMRPLSNLLAAHFRVISFDNRCVGRSDQPEQPFTTGDMADDAAALLDHLEVESAHVLGISLGGMIAQELALRHPLRVRRLALGCTHAGFTSAVRAPDWAVRVFAESRDMPREQALRHSIPILFAERTVREQPDLVEAVLSAMINNNQPKASYLLQLGAAVNHDTIDRLPTVAHPTLVLTGTEDMLISSANSQIIAGRIPGARLLELPETGHLFFSEQPATVGSALIEFFNNRTGRDS